MVIVVLLAMVLAWVPDAWSNFDPVPTPIPEWTATARVTAYCLQGRMRNGEYVHLGAAATDRSVIPEGSIIEIENLGTYISKDTGGGVIGWHVDVWTPSCTTAYQIGNSFRKIRITRWGY